MALLPCLLMLVAVMLLGDAALRDTARLAAVSAADADAQRAIQHAELALQEGERSVLRAINGDSATGGLLFSYSVMPLFVAEAASGYRVTAVGTARTVRVILQSDGYVVACEPARQHLNSDDPFAQDRPPPEGDADCPARYSRRAWRRVEPD